ncbi:hypothetical protein P8A18_19140 [Streptomyces castrisilvae]|uniref:Membrane protein YndG n=1 Tax=Streptomyces castrisilvae TaxID=3033811 RepID=A0ABY9HLM6_9ACTN|nr:hypothetical protein [Streptomyces sp. Mut1]WLQ35410.1 hypothetical protein P8A18_19140 [Streptomyces sp. Mut1]
MGGGLYIEARIRAGLECVWERTQDPAQHQRWDLRFTRIAYLPRAEGEPQRFTYGVRVLPGLLVAGTGTSAGERHRPDGTRTSALRFACAHPLSFLTEGRGYWRYVPVPVPVSCEGGRAGGVGPEDEGIREGEGDGGPADGGTPEDGGGRAGGGGPEGSGIREGGVGPESEGGRVGGGIRFLTGYDYEPRWGRPGRLADRLLFRPLMGWATAWSFDRLRLWCERGITPERALRRGLAEAAVRPAVVVLAAWSASLAPVPSPLAGVPALLLAVPVLLAAVLLPPLPGTPSAARCLRRPPERGATAPPALLHRLERP